MQKHIEKIFNLALVVLFLALTGAWDAGAFAQTQTPTATKTELESAAEPKRALETIGSQDFKRPKIAKLRDAAIRALAALKKLAKNTSKAREAALVADFDRTMEALKLVLPPAKSGGLEIATRTTRTVWRCARKLGSTARVL